jgi:WD40 repeat protein/serine/threonine protein kinase
MFDVVGKVIKGYELISEIGAGGFGAVYRAYQPSVGREVAVKIILPQYANNADFIRRFEAEAQLVARLEHLHIVPLYDYWREPGGAYLVMRYLRGGNARRQLIENGAMDLATTTRLLEQMASALAIAHRNRIIHRDLKPDNILLDENGNFFLADFGIAKDMSSGDVNKTGPIIGSPAYFSPEQIRGLEVKPQTDIYTLGIMLFELLTGQHPFEGTNAQGLVYKHLIEPLPSIRSLRPDLPSGIDLVIQKATAKEPADRYTDTLSMYAAFKQATGYTRTTLTPNDETTIIIRREETRTTPTMGFRLPDPPNPYKGLRAFLEADASDFFGRDVLVKSLLQRLENTRFLAVIGPSGGGKSSVVRAGLLPALRRGAIAGSRNWFYVEMHPGDAPLIELEAALLRVAVNPPDSLMSQLAENERGLLRALKRTLPEDGSELLLLVDQFEELFTLVDEDETRTHFINNLLTAIQDPRSRVRVIITLRADFYDRPLLYPEFGELIRESTAVVLPLSKADLERAILGPAERVGLVIEPQLVSAIIQDVAGTGALPLMQYALTELYERRDGRILTFDAYREIGGVTGALARRAEELYLELWEPTKIIAQQIFLRLVNLGEGSEDTRRRVMRTELMGLNPSDVPDAVEYVLDQFGKYRLLTFDHDPVTREPTIEVAHEALIREWSRLRGWLENSRDDLRTQRRLAAAANEWLSIGQDISYLAHGTQLTNFREWATVTRVTLSDLEREYMRQSIRKDEADQLVERQRQEREAMLEQRSMRRLQAFVLLAAVAAVLGVGLSIFAFGQRNAAQNNADIAATAVYLADSSRVAAERTAAEAQSLALAASAQQALTNNNSDLALALALEANTLENPPPQAQRVLAETAYAPGTQRIFSGHTNFVLSVDYSPDGQQIASASADGTIRLWDVASGALVHRLSGHSAAVNEVHFSADGTRLISASADGSLRLWDVASGEFLLAARTLDNIAVLSAIFSPTGDAVLASTADGTIYAWDLSSTSLTDGLSGHDAPVYDLAFSPRGRTFISASADGTMRLWNTADGNEIRRFLPPVIASLAEAPRLLTVTFDPNGLSAFSGAADGSIREWDTRFGQEVRQFFGHTGAVTYLKVSADGQYLLSVSEDGTLRVWDVVTSEERLRLRGHSASINSVAISPDGRTAVTGSNDNTLRLWDLQSGAELNRLSDVSQQWVLVDVAPNSLSALSGSRTGRIELWDLSNVNNTRPFWQSDGTVDGITTPNDDPITALDISPDERLAVSGTRSGKVILWWMNDGTVLQQISGITGGVNAATFTEDSGGVLIAVAPQTLIFYEVNSGRTRYTVNVDAGTISVLRVVPGQARILAGLNTGELLMLDLDTGAVLYRVGEHDDSITDIEISTDGTRALTGSRDQSVRLWDITQTDPNATALMRLEGQGTAVLGVSLDWENQRAIASGADGTLLVWDLAIQRTVQQFSSHSSAVSDVAFVQGRRQAISASLDGTIRRWQTLSLPQLTEWVRANRFVQPFTCQQREQYRILPLCEGS